MAASRALRVLGLLRRTSRRWAKKALTVSQVDVGDVEVPSAPSPLRAWLKTSSNRKVSRWAVTVWALTWRWFIRRSVKNACRVGASVAFAAHHRRLLLDGPRPSAQQLRGAGQVPVRGTDIDVPEVGGKRRHVCRHVLVFAIPAQQAGDTKRVA